MDPDSKKYTNDPNKIHHIFMEYIYIILVPPLVGGRIQLVEDTSLQNFAGVRRLRRHALLAGGLTLGLPSDARARLISSPCSMGQASRADFSLVVPEKVFLWGIRGT